MKFMQKLKTPTIKTRVIRVNDASDYRLHDAAKLILEGKLVAFPTETVYGLGANALDHDAVMRIFKAKKRPLNDPLIVHVSDIEMARKIVEHFDERALLLAHEFWPGPFTMVMRKSLIIPDITTSGLPTVAIRVPNNKIALRLISLANCPIAAPSANYFQRTSATRGRHVRDDFMGEIEMIIDEGIRTAEIKPTGIESTIIDLTKKDPVILRLGSTPVERIRAVLGPSQKVLIHGSISEKGTNGDGVREAPGMGKKHYAPEYAKIVTFMRNHERLRVLGKILKRAEHCNKAGKTVEIVLSQHLTGSFVERMREYAGVHVFQDEIRLGQELSNIVRKLDRRNTVILIEGVDPKWIGAAIMDHLRRMSKELVEPPSYPPVATRLK